MHQILNIHLNLKKNDNPYNNNTPQNDNSMELIELILVNFQGRKQYFRAIKSHLWKTEQSTECKLFKAPWALNFISNKHKSLMTALSGQ